MSAGSLVAAVPAALLLGTALATVVTAAAATGLRAARGRRADRRASPVLSPPQGRVRHRPLLGGPRHCR